MASELNTPPVLLKPFADSGDKNNIPETATGTQQASLDEGFPPVTSLPLTQGGIPPERKDFNGLGNLLSKQYFYLQNGGRFTFNQDVSDAIGGYPQNATLWFKDEALGVNYPVTSLINNNTYNFVTTPSYIDGVKWKRVVDSFPSTQITNCLTEIPQDIKLTLSSGTLTLKAGSKIYIPNGSGVFDTVTIARDITVTKKSNTPCFVFYVSNTLYVWEVSGATSGTTAPSGTGTWYDTTNNKVKRYVSGSQTVGGLSLPIAIVNFSSNSITSIDQVFNGFGYMGSTVFALPGVKGLIPNGRNADGTLKDSEFTTSRVITNEITGTRDNFQIRVASNYIRWGIMNYDEEKNINIFYDNTIKQEVIAGTFSSNNGVITSFKPKTAFHAVDYNDFSDLSDKVDTNTSDISTLQNTKQDIATAVNYDNISNCITEIPQDIKLEINSSGKAVLKAGSKVYLPNGFETDGTTPKFEVYTIASDVTYNFLSSNNGKYFLANLNNGQSAGWSRVNFSESGTSTESNSAFYYRTDDNKVYYLNDSSGSIYTLPLAIVNLTNGVATIDQVFNGFGYIGSTVFALPGVKGLIPNGRNADGTLKNISVDVTSSRILTLANTVTLNEDTGRILLGMHNVFARVGYYNEEENYTVTNAGQHLTGLEACKVACTNGIISKLVVKTAFHAVDYNDAMLKSDWIMVSSTPPADADPNKFYYTAES